MQIVINPSVGVFRHHQIDNFRNPRLGDGKPNIRAYLQLAPLIWEDVSVLSRVSSTTTMGMFLSLVLTATLVGDRSGAQELFNFVEAETGDVLARMELASLPATRGELIELSFTVEGEDKFGLGASYLGTFDYDWTSSTTLVADGTGGLSGLDGLVQWYDQDPPYTMVPPDNLYAYQFFMIFDDPYYAAHRADSIWLGSGNFDAGEGLYLTASGRWSQVVPEPSAMLLTGIALGGLLLIRRCSRY